MAPEPPADFDETFEPPIEPYASDRQTSELIHWGIKHVKTDYVLKDGIDGEIVVISPHDIGFQSEAPSTSPYRVEDELPQIANELAKMEDGDTDSVLKFVDRYGLLGRCNMLPSERHTIPSKPPDGWWLSTFGDPLWWIFAHAKTVRWCQEVAYLIQTNTPESLQRVRYMSRNADVRRWAVRDTVTTFDDIFEYLQSADSYEDGVWNNAAYICDMIINENIAGITRTQRTDRDGKVRSHYKFRSLIEAVYWHLADAREGGRVHQCEADDCRSFFIQADASQRFCPPAPGEKESKCSRRQRMKRYRSNPEKREREKRLQRERYHREKQS